MKRIHPRIEPEYSQVHLDWEFPFLSYPKLPIIIGLTGPTKCGKTIMAERLVVRYGFHYISMSSVIAEVAKQQGIEITSWEVIGNSGKRLREVRGTNIFAKIIIDRLRKLLVSQNKVVVDGILHPDEVFLFREFTCFRLIGIDADIKTRSKAAASWYGGSLKTNKMLLSKRDEFEQYSIDRFDNLAPNVRKCLDIAGMDNSIISLSSFNKKIVFDQIEVRTQELMRGMM